MATLHPDSHFSAENTHSKEQSIDTNEPEPPPEEIRSLRCSHCALQFVLGQRTYKLFIELDVISEDWKCSNCFRGIHHCRYCGFLGIESVDLVRCSLPYCRQFIHSRCLEKAQISWKGVEIVCPLHFCNLCGQHEPIIAKLQMCTQCPVSRHFHCEMKMEALDSTNTITMTTSDHRKPDNRMRKAVCTSHAVLLTHTYQLWTCQLAKKHFLQNGDIVLLLENSDDQSLYKIRKGCKSSNFWGIVIQVVALNQGMQAIDVKLFADFSHVATYNKNVLAVSNIHHYDDQISMLKDCVKWHAHCECTIQLRKEQESPGKVKKVLLASRNAFSALANALSVSNRVLDQVAEMGYQSYHQIERNHQMGNSIAPAFAYIDTRPIDTLPSSQVETIDSLPLVPFIESSKLPEGPIPAEGVNVCDLEACVLNFFKDENMKTASSSMRSFLVRGLYVAQPLHNIFLIQEKRGVQVYLQKGAIECAHRLSYSTVDLSRLKDPRKWKRSERRIAYFRVDLLACAGFKALVSTIFNQLEICMGKQFNLSKKFPIFYCSIDGKRHELQWNGKYEMNWNIFCANVRHLSLHVL